MFLLIYFFLYRFHLPHFLQCIRSIFKSFLVQFALLVKNLLTTRPQLQQPVLIKNLLQQIPQQHTTVIGTTLHKTRLYCQQNSLDFAAGDRIFAYATFRVSHIPKSYSSVQYSQNSTNRKKYGLTIPKVCVLIS